MKSNKMDIMDMNIQKLSNYSSYVDTFSRMVHNFIENGLDSIKYNDLVNTTFLLEKYSHILHTSIIKTKKDWEFNYDKYNTLN